MKYEKWYQMCWKEPPENGELLLPVYYSFNGRFLMCFLRIKRLHRLVSIIFIDFAADQLTYYM